MMRFFGMVIALALPLLLMWWVMRPSDNLLTPVVREHMSEYITAIEAELGESDPACLNHVGPFPIDLVRQFLPPGCTDCAALVQAGLISKDSGSGIYRLAALGKQHYTEVVDARRVVHGNIAREALRQPRLCFGETRVHAIVESLPAFPFGSDKAISVKVIMEVREPSSFLFTEQARTLELPKPTQSASGQPWLLPPKIVSFVTNHNGTILYFDNSIRYGKWIKEQ